MGAETSRFTAGRSCLATFCCVQAAINFVTDVPVTARVGAGQLAMSGAASQDDPQDSALITCRYLTMRALVVFDR
jgi:hypothetical protein